VTDLVMRTFQAKRGSQAALGQCLSRLASETIRQTAGTTVSVFRVENDPQRFVWLGDCGDERELTRLPPLSAALIDEWLRSTLAAPATGRTLRLIEEYHRRPLGPYHIWSVEIQTPAEHDSDPAAELRAARGDTRLVGDALYRALDDPTVVVFLLGLAWGVTPSAVGLNAARPGRSSILGTLGLVLDLFRLTWEGPCEGPGVPRAPFPEWIRDGVASRAAVSVRAPLSPDGGLAEDRRGHEFRRS
jgi:hypothetical protein